MLAYQPPIHKTFLNICFGAYNSFKTSCYQKTMNFGVLAY